MKIHIKKLFATLQMLLSDWYQCHTTYYRISSIDFDEQTAVLNVVHKNIFFTHTFSEIIANPKIIDGLSCQQACWLGIYYGRSLRTALAGKRNFKNINPPDFFLQHKYGRYKIISENRDGSILCIHTKTKQELNTQQISIAKDEHFIKNFDKTQACYIGILTGISIEKKRRLASTTNTQKEWAPYLKVVK